MARKSESDKIYEKLGDLPYVVEEKRKKAERHQNNRDQKTEYNKQYYQNNRERLLDQAAEYRQNNRERIAEYYQNNREKVRGKQVEYYQNLRSMAYKLLGNHCMYCGCCGPDMLVIDHINGGGKLEVRELGSHIYARVINHPDPNSTYQLLCATCNEIKAYESGERATGTNHADAIYRSGLRDQIIRELGTYCHNCGWNRDGQVLHIDHVKNNGGAERKKFGGANFKYYQYILDNLSSGDYTILCPCCHLAKSYRPNAWKQISMIDALQSSEITSTRK